MFSYDPELRTSNALEKLVSIFSTKNRSITFANQILNELSEIRKHLQEQNRLLSKFVESQTDVQEHQLF
jgi:hypothetical protein